MIGHDDKQEVEKLAADLGGLQIDSSLEEKKEGGLQEDADEVGPIMGFYAACPKSECPHCIPGEHISPIEEFADINIHTPCHECGHANENWVCLKCKVVGCSRYIKSHLKAHYEQEKHPIALSFADFSYWCYECESYVISKHLTHVKHFYP